MINDMNLDVLEARVARLEEINTSIPLLAQRLDTLSSQVADLIRQSEKRFEMLQEVRDKVMASGPQCPKPGMCLGLETRIIACEDLLKTIKTESEVTSKGWRSAGIIVGVLMGLSGLLVAIWKMVELIVHRKGAP